MMIDLYSWFTDFSLRGTLQVSMLNRGFGGAKIKQVTYYANQIVLPYHPKKVIECLMGDHDPKPPYCVMRGQ